MTPHVVVCVTAVVVWALRVRADALRCGRGGCYCIAISTLNSERQQHQRRRCCVEVACGNFGNFSPSVTAVGVSDGCVLKASPLLSRSQLHLSRLQLHIAVYNLSVDVEWQHWTPSGCGGTRFAEGTLRGRVEGSALLCCRRHCSDCIVFVVFECCVWRLRVRE